MSPAPGETVFAGPGRRASTTSRFLLDVAAGRVESATEEIDQSSLALAYRHGLIGLLSQETPGSPDSLVRPVYARILAHQQVIDAHTPRLLAALDRANVPASVLKGPFLDREIYPFPGLRTYTDLDVLVPAHHLSRALEVLAADEAIGRVPPRGPRASKRELSVRDPRGMNFSLDLHWDLFGYSQLLDRARGATEWAFARARRSEGALGPNWVLPLEATLPFLATHALLDHRFRLILFRDLAELTQHDIDWEAVGAFAVRFGLRSTTYLALWITARATGADIPPGVLSMLRPSSLPIRVAEILLPRTDLVTFNGHGVHPLNLAIVMMHDDRSKRIRLMLRGPSAFPGWLRRAANRPSVGVDGRNQDRPGSLMMVTTTNQRRGAEVQAELLAKGLHARGWKVELVTLTNARDQPTVGGDPLTDRAPDRLGRLDIDVLGGLERRMRQSKPDIVVAFGSATLRYTVFALAARARPRLVYVSIGEPSYWIRNWSHRWQQRLLLSRAHAVVAVSLETGNQLVKYLRLPQKVVSVAHPGVPSSLLDIRREPGRSECHVLFLGSMSNEKDPAAALRAVADLDRKLLARLRFVGSGMLQPELERLRDELGIGDSVEFSGAAADIAPHLAWADILLMTSRTEGLPGAVLEAAAASVPVVAFDVGGTREAVVDDVTGRLIPRGDHTAMVEALCELAADSDLRVRYGDAGRHLVESHFLMEHAVERYHQLLLDELRK